MFELEVNNVHALVSKMIINEELMASLDQPSQCVVMHRSVPSSLAHVSPNSQVVLHSSVLSSIAQVSPE